MSLQDFLDSGRLKRHKAAAEEIHKLFEVVRRDLSDSKVPGLSKEHRHVLDYLDDCRSKRNLAEYLGTEVASEQEVAELVREAEAFSKLLHGLIRRRHPHLLK